MQEIKIKSISTSIKLDMHPINKTYQNQNLTYKDIINSALKDYKKTDYIYQVKEERKIDNIRVRFNLAIPGSDKTIINNYYRNN